VSAHSLKIAPASRFIRVWRSDVGRNHWISDGPTPGQRLADTIESIAEPPLTVLSFEDEAELHPGDAFRTVFRAQRGGSFMHSRWETRSATRINYAVMTDTTDYMGFRVARTVRVFPPK